MYEEEISLQSTPPAAGFQMSGERTSQRKRELYERKAGMGSTSGCGQAGVGQKVIAK